MLLPFYFWFAANVAPKEWDDSADIGKKEHGSTERPPPRCSWYIDNEPT